MRWPNILKSGGLDTVSEFTLSKKHAGKSRVEPTTKVPHRAPPKKDLKDSLTLARLVAEALSDVKVTLKSDPHLRLMMRELAASDDVSAEKTALEVDGYISRWVADYLSNPRRRPRVRFPRVDVMSSANLAMGTARAVVRIRCWGHAQRCIIDLDIPR